jgi:hypothetical protein
MSEPILGIEVGVMEAVAVSARDSAASATDFPDSGCHIPTVMTSINPNTTAMYRRMILTPSIYGYKLPLVYEIILYKFYTCLLDAL